MICIALCPFVLCQMKDFLKRMSKRKVHFAKGQGDTAGHTQIPTLCHHSQNSLVFRPQRTKFTATFLFTSHTQIYLDSPCYLLLTQIRFASPRNCPRRHSTYTLIIKEIRLLLFKLRQSIKMKTYQKGCPRRITRHVHSINSCLHGRR